MSCDKLELKEISQTPFWLNVILVENLGIGSVNKDKMKNSDAIKSINDRLLVRLNIANLISNYLLPELPYYSLTRRWQNRYYCDAAGYRWRRSNLK